MFINCHTHTLRSHDSEAKPYDICEKAVNDGLNGIVFSDHCDCEFYKTIDIFGLFSQAEQDFNFINNLYGEKLSLFFGIELGDPLFAPDFAEKIVCTFPFDAVLLSVHAVRVPGYEMPFSRIDFGFADDAFIHSYLKQYFLDVLESVRRFDFDILCHLTVPLRYIRLKYGKNADITPFEPTIDLILKELIEKGKTLEINTSALSLPGGFLMPDEKIIDRYIAMGGNLFSIGSDAHSASQVSFGIIDAAEMLKRKNIKSLVCYKNRTRLVYEI